MLFSNETAPKVADQLRQLVKAPHVGIGILKVGPHNLAIALSLDPKTAWVNGIFENSRYIKVILDQTGELRSASYYGTKRLRRSTCMSVEQVADKLNKWVAACTA